MQQAKNLFRKHGPPSTITLSAELKIPANAVEEFKTPSVERPKTSIPKWKQKASLDENKESTAKIVIPFKKNITRRELTTH